MFERQWPLAALAGLVLTNEVSSTRHLWTLTFF